MSHLSKRNLYEGELVDEGKEQFLRRQVGCAHSSCFRGPGPFRQSANPPLLLPALRHGRNSTSPIFGGRVDGQPWRCRSPRNTGIPRMCCRNFRPLLLAGLNDLVHAVDIIVYDGIGVSQQQHQCLTKYTLEECKNQVARRIFSFHALAQRSVDLPGNHSAFIVIRFAWSLISCLLIAGLVSIGLSMTRDTVGVSLVFAFWGS